MRRSASSGSPQGVRHPHSAAHFGVIAFRPRAAGALIEPGVSDVVGQMLTLETHTRGFPSAAPADDRTSAGRTQSLSPSMLALTFLPLLVILAGHRLIVGEREHGNLALLMAAGSSPAQLVWGKTAALALAAAGLVGVTAVVDAVGVALVDPAGLDGPLLGQHAIRLAYVLIWVGVTIAVSARARSSRVALAVLLALWMANSFVLPRAAASAGRLVAPEPSAETFRAAIRHDISYRADGTLWVEGWSQRLVKETLERYGVTRIEDLPIGYAGVMLKGSDAHYESVFERHFTALHDLHRRQERWYHLLSAFGPVLAARSLGQAFAGTDLAHVQHFSDAAEAYRRMFVEATNEAIETQSPGTGWDIRLGREYWESIPAFDYEPPSTTWVMARHPVAWVVLLAWLLLAGAGVLTASRHVRGAA